MTLARIVLIFTGLVWVGYGGWLFFDPTGLSYMGYQLDHWSTIVEVKAMYGAVEFMLGIFAWMGVWRPHRYMHSALLVWFFIFVALIVGRVVGIIQYGGDWWLEFGADGLPDAYNPGALWFYEVPSAILSGIALWKTRHLLD